ncbi:angiopoietin-related protein 4-like [Leucoraja erinacea]|uniref:angiopoietin-related protein 4-like n=1 Tax=Leucoraja erinaceus TaxID=7782 RepID=UPI00245891C6|nr:angiopoietin-related protein 4-like [Leucoraja erinacea]
MFFLRKCFIVSKPPPPANMKVLNRGFESKEYYNFRKRKGNNSANDQNGHLSVSPNSDCYQIFKRGERTSGVYRIQPEGSQPFQTYCQMTAELGWTVIQQRFNGSVNFDHLWLDYKTGFGAPQGEFWLGLENFYQIARQDQYVLRIELEDWKKKSRHIDYAFMLGNEDNSYSLQISQVLSGDLSSTMSSCKAVPFSTTDRDSDLHSMINCAEQHSGGWWFSGCGESNLNGKYFRSRINRRPDRKKGIFWKSWKGNYYSFKSTRLMIRPLRIINQ